MASLAESRTRRPRGRPGLRWVLVALAVALLAAGAAAAIVLLTDDDSDTPASRAPVPAAEPEPDTLGELDGITQVGGLLGNREAPTLTVYADVASEEYAEFDREILPVLLKDYVRPAKLKIQLRTRHDDDDAVARRAATYAQAAGLQTKLWDYVRALAEVNDGTPTRADLEEAAELAGLDLDRLGEDTRSERVRRAVVRGVELAAERGFETATAFTIFDGTRTSTLETPDAAEAFTAQLDRAIDRDDDG